MRTALRTRADILLCLDDAVDYNIYATASATVHNRRRHFHANVRTLLGRGFFKLITDFVFVFFLFLFHRTTTVPCVHRTPYASISLNDDGVSIEIIYIRFNDRVEILRSRVFYNW